MILPESMRRFLTYLVLACPALAAAPAPVEKDGYRIEWTAVNWQGGIQTRGSRMEWEASLSGRVAGPADWPVVAFLVQVNSVLDPHGRSLLPGEFERRWSTPRRPRRENQVQRVLTRRPESGDLGAFTVSLGGGAAPVGKIALVRGTVYVMEVSRSLSLDLPLQVPAGGWHEAEGVRFRVDNVEQRGQQTTVHLSHNLGEDATGSEGLSQPPYLYAALPIDEQGRDTSGQTANIANRGDGQLIVSLVSPTGQPPRPAALRLLVAAAVEERKIEFELADLELGVARKKEPAAANDKQPQRNAPAAE